MSKYFHNEDLNLMLRRGVYPYEYMTDISKFGERGLPPKKAFNSRLDTGAVSSLDEMLPSEISDDDYRHALEVFKTLNCKNLGDYTELYCKSDVLLLADVFENFINICLEARSITLHYGTIFILGCHVKDDGGETGAPNGYRHVLILRKRDSWGYINDNKQICKGQ